MDAQWFLNLFTAQEWRSFIWLLLGTLTATHTVKIIWRWSPWKGGNHSHITLVSVIAAFAIAFFIWPAGSGPWWLAGIVAGPVSNIAFKLGFGLLKRYAPDLAATVNMDRRQAKNGLPPQGRSERRK